MINRRTFLSHVAAGSGALLLPGCGSAGAQGAGEPLPDGPQLGVNASLGGKRIFPADNAWNQPVADLPVDPNSAALTASIGIDRNLHPDFGTFWNNSPTGMSYVVVGGDQPRVPVSFHYADESDPGPYPIPPDAPIEGGPASTGDRHVLVVDRDAWRLYELFDARPVDNGARWTAGSGAIWDLTTGAPRPPGWTSADAAGLPILPGLVRWDEVMERGVIDHALRFTVRRTRRAYVAPASHWASSLRDENLPPMGMRVRLKASVDISRYAAPVRVILTALRDYGMMVADNGSDWYLSGGHDPRWDDSLLGTIKRIKGSDFEVVQMGELTVG